MDFYVVDLGKVGYEEALGIQDRVIESVANGGTDVLLLLEHYPVFTVGLMGRREGSQYADMFKLDGSDEEVVRQLKDRGIDFYLVNRGGHVTYHGPGQLVGYSIRNLEDGDMGSHNEGLERTIFETAKEFVPDAYTRTEEQDPRTHVKQGIRGVWLDGKKLGATGTRRNHVNGKYVTKHGFALNVSPDDNFKLIDPCGFEGVDASSLEKASGRDVPIEEVKRIALEKYRNAFGYSSFEEKTLDEVLG